MSDKAGANLRLRVRIDQHDPELKGLFAELSEIDERFRNKRLLQVLREHERSRMPATLERFYLPHVSIATPMQSPPLPLTTPSNEAPALKALSAEERAALTSEAMGRALEQTGY